MKVTFFPYQAHCFASGGFENLINSTFNSLKLKDVEINKIDLWSKDDDFEIAHFWGFGPPNYDNIKWAKKKNKKIVVTILIPDYRSIFDKFKYLISTLLGRRKDFNELLFLVDALIVTSERSKEIAIKLYKVPTKKVFLIPNTLLDSYYVNYSDKQLKSFVLQDYVFTIGNVCNRKNQLRLAKACIKLNLNLLIVGPTLLGEEEYGKELQDLIKTVSNIVWINEMKRDSDELISTYRNSLLFALPSFDEQQPTSAQEAGLLGKPILLANLPYARQKFYSNASLVNPSSVDSIVNGIEAILKNPSNFIPPNEVFNECKSANVANQYINIYNKIINP
jgi:glycosyltransferase involved in cell wall biosynthesis